ncbi:MAG: GNAT family N-acetyltransferase [Clostridia bacterium]|nr:GNAT family N-acetyltransferase [Clostridia bacterium]
MRFRIVEGAENMNTADIVRLLRNTYWAANRPDETIEKSLRHSSCFGVWAEDAQRLVGFARVISDYATTFYLCDVVIDPEYRRQGLGTALLSHIHALPEFSSLRGLLLTRDAHGLYEKFGYQTVRDRAMLKAL